MLFLKYSILEKGEFSLRSKTCDSESDISRIREYIFESTEGAKGEVIKYVWLWCFYWTLLKCFHQNYCQFAVGKKLNLPVSIFRLNFINKPTPSLATSQPGHFQVGKMCISKSLRRPTNS